MTIFGKIKNLKLWILHQNGKVYQELLKYSYFLVFLWLLDLLLDEKQKNEKTITTITLLGEEVVEE